MVSAVSVAQLPCAVCERVQGPVGTNGIEMVRCFGTGISHSDDSASPADGFRRSS